MGVTATMQLPADTKADCYLELLEAQKDVVLESKKLHPPDNPFQRAFVVSPLPQGYRVRVRCEGFKQVYTSGWAVIAASGGLTLLAWIIGLAGRGS